MSAIRRNRTESIRLTRENVAEVRALLEAAPAITTAPWPVPDILGISLTITSPFTTGHGVVLEGDTVVTTATEFHVVIAGGNTVRARIPKYLMPEDHARWVRDIVWTPGIREEHRTNTGRRTHACSCQFGTSWQCGEGELHHKCIYGRDSAMWMLASPECTITWPDGKDAEFAEPIRNYTYNQGKTWQDHRALVWLADRTCRSGCGCGCHKDVLSRPPAPMSDEAAEWVRALVWTKNMRKAHSNVPDAARRCACQYGPSGHCDAGKHEKCWHSSNKPFASPEAFVCGPDGTQVLVLDERFAHPTGSATGPKRDQSAMVWLADRSCRWRCPCDCHTNEPASPEPPLMPRSSRNEKPQQLDLFDLEGAST